MVLLGREREGAHLLGLVEGVRHGQSAALVLHGEAGVGKTALLDHVERSAPDLRVARVVGTEWEREFAFAALHQLCRPFLDHLDRLPGPQGAALATAFGLASGAPPDRILTGLAMLSLLCEVAEDRPLLCIVDDADWLDSASAEALGFAARRLHGESVLMLFAAREVDGNLRGLPDLPLAGLDERHANELLAAVRPGALEARVRQRIVAETRGNPLALIELPHDISGTTQTVGSFAQVEATYVRRVEGLPAETRLVVLIAATEPAGDPVLLTRAAARLGIDSSVLRHDELVGLVEVGERVLFHHPLVRSAIYSAAAPAERRMVHAALAEVFDPESDPDRVAWHRAQATFGPDDAVAGELADAAERAQRRGGWAAAAAFLERAVELTQDASLRAARALAAGHAHHLAGAADAALRMLSVAESGPLDALQQARVELLKAEVAYAQNRGADPPGMLLRAAAILHPLDAELSRQTYLDALWAAHFAGRSVRGATLIDIARAGRAAVPPGPQHPPDLLLDGLATAAIDGYAAAAPTLKRAVKAFRSPTVNPDEELRWLWHASVVAMDLWDDESLDLLAARHVEVGRENGALAVLPIAFSARILTDVFAGRFAQAAQGIDGLRTVTEVMGIPLPAYGPVVLAAWRGREGEALALIDAAIPESTARGEGAGVAVAQYARAVLYNGLGHYSEALIAAIDSDRPGVEGFTVVSMSLVETIEAAVRSGQRDTATAAMERLNEMAEASGTEWGLGNRARSQALLTPGRGAESLYQEAIERFGRTRIRVHLARAHLLYGEWLRRDNRRVEARAQLRCAHELFTTVGAEAFAERARRELQATGETVRARTVETRDDLTAQEGQIARLAAEGRTNPEIGAELFISARTVEWHLRKIYPKLGISSRKQLRAALSIIDQVAAS